MELNTKVLKKNRDCLNNCVSGINRKILQNALQIGKI